MFPLPAMTSRLLLRQPSLVPPLDPGFRPAVLGHRTFARAVEVAGGGVPLHLALLRSADDVTRFSTRLLPDNHPHACENVTYAERLLKFLLWQKGACEVRACGPGSVVAHLASQYGPEGARAFDGHFMAEVYESSCFSVRHVAEQDLPREQERTLPIGGHLEGCRIGFDAGGSDRKVASVIDGQEVFSAELPWQPKLMSDPAYHVNGVREALELAARHLPRVDAIGVSSAGIYVENRTRVASLFRKVPPDAFKETIESIYIDAAKRFGGVPLRVANDGDVTALAGALSLREGQVLGLAMGTSEAVGYVNESGLLTGWLNELAFAPVDFSEAAPCDTEWSCDRGVGSQYFSQDAAIRLATRAQIVLDSAAPLADQLEEVQGLVEKGDQRAIAVYQSLGIYLGYGLLYYAEFYPLKHVLLLGRVMSGEGGRLLVDGARQVLAEVDPRLAEELSLHLPGEASRRVGQAIAAASLPQLRE